MTREEKNAWQRERRKLDHNCATNKYEKAICLSDVHAPYEDLNAIEKTMSFIKWYKPDRVFLLGDIIDFYSISSFDKNPDEMDLQRELDSTISFLKKLRKSAPKAQIDFLWGNHCLRLQKYIWKNSGILKLKKLKLEELLELKDYNINLIPPKEKLYFYNIRLEHGKVVRKHSGYSAKAQMEARGMTGISGHTHRLGSHYLSNESGFYAWFENGCLCELNPEYADEPNWQQGFTIINHRTDGDRFDIQQLCITDGKLSFMGKEF